MSDSHQSLNSNSPVIAAVVIGRNEGERLKRCISSLKRDIQHVVYVDSGSNDDSVTFAQSQEVMVVELDMNYPFTAARARNEGVKYLETVFPQIEYIQFVDGDCEIQEGWVDAALTFLTENPQYAVACGRRRERHPEHSIFNQLCDIEWDTPVGDALACGGDALIRFSALKSVGGYPDAMIAGEEPELCFRLRHQGWHIMRLGIEMTLHDANMSKVSQWWKRHKRAGHAYAESYTKHGKSKESFRKRECQRIIFWAGVIPSLVITLSWLHPSFVLLLLIYPMQGVRLAKIYKQQLLEPKLARLYATSNVLSKFPQLLGLFSYHWSQLCGKQNNIIEYK